MPLSLPRDWLNPMLVRDLRQALRSRVFTLVFLLLQGGMSFFVVLGLTSSEEGSISAMLNGILWIGLTLFYIILLPLTAAGSLSPEFRDGRLDLLKLTQMSARGLMVGKWLSLCAQGVMVAVSLLPYIVLSYYTGGVELASELSLMGLMLGFSALLIGFCLAISSMNSGVLRGLLILAYIFCFGLALNLFSRPYMYGGGYYGGGYGGGSFFGGIGAIFTMLSSGSGYAGAALILAVIGLPAWWLCMEFGAARLAPAAENHDTPQRWMLPIFCLLTSGILAVDAFKLAPGSWDEFGGTVFFIILMQMLWVLMLAMATDPSPFPDTYRFYVRGGSLRRSLGRLAFYPGWPSAVFLILFLSALFEVFGWWLSRHVHNFHFSNYLTYCLVIPSALIFPHVAGVALKRTRITSGLRYFSALIACIVVMIGCMLLAYATGRVTAQQGYFAAACLLPPDALILLPTVDWDFPEHYYAIGAAIATGIPTVIVGVIQGIRYWPRFAALERRAEAINETAKKAKIAALSAAKSAPVSSKQLVAD